MRFFSSTISHRVMIATALNVSACAGQLDPIQNDNPQIKQQGHGNHITEIYPQSPDVHYATSAQTRSETPLVLNAVAYARYAVELTGETRIGFETEVVPIAMAMAEQADASGLSFSSLLRYKNVGASETDYQAFAEEVERDARSVQQPGVLSRELKSVVDGTIRLELCVAENNDIGGC